MDRKKANLVRVGAAIPSVKVADVNENVVRIIELIREANQNDIDILVFPELCITGYSCGDLFHQSTLLESAKSGIDRVKKETLINDMIVIIGAPVQENGKLLNAAIIIQNGEIKGVVGKKFLPGYKEFYEERWFSEDTKDVQVFKTPDFTFGVEICEDVWSVVPPSCRLVQKGAELIFNLSASNELIGKHEYLVSLLKQQSARCISGYVYASSGYGESTQDVVYAGNAIVLENGKILGKSARFQKEKQLVFNDIDLESLRNERLRNTTFAKGIEEADRISESVFTSKKPRLDTVRAFNAHPFAHTQYKEVLDIQSYALAKRLEHTGMKAIIGVSGGSDSTWALLVCVEAMDILGRPRTDIIGVTMPGYATGERTLKNSKALMTELGITQREIRITKICDEALAAMNHDKETQDVTFENVQARTRTDLLMNLSNQEGALVIGTGDLSELALGWCTYNADHMSMYGVNTGIPKTLIKALIKWYSENVWKSDVLTDILDTPVSPELTGSGAEGENAQVTEDKIGPYELHDFFLYNMLRHGFGPKKILYMAEHSKFSKPYTIDDLKKWLRVFIDRFFSQQFKRSCLPDGPKVGSISLSPRGDWRMPSDSCRWEWIREIEQYQNP